MFVCVSARWYTKAISNRVRGPSVPDSFIFTVKKTHLQFATMGYELTRFQGEVDEELVCPICAGVMEEPLQVCIQLQYFENLINLINLTWDNKMFVYGFCIF